METTHSHDHNGNRLTSYDARPFGSSAAGTRVNKDFQYVYDNLDRLKESKRGVYVSSGGGSWTYANSGGVNYHASQKWTLDELGNWKEAQTDKDGDGAYTTTSLGESTEGDFNFANEIEDLTVIDSPQVATRTLWF